MELCLKYSRLFFSGHGVYGVGVITKMYFVIFAAFKESRTLNLAQRSFMVIHFGGNRKSVYDFIHRPLIATFTVSSTVSEILPVLYAKANCVYVSK